jgi:hypothetical protein
MPSGSTPRRKYRGRHEGRGGNAVVLGLGQAQLRSSPASSETATAAPPNRWRHDEHGHEDGHADNDRPSFDSVTSR